jgi:hypothetical protein
VQECGLVQIAQRDHVVRRFKVRLVHGHKNWIRGRRGVLLDEVRRSQAACTDTARAFAQERTVVRAAGKAQRHVTKERGGQHGARHTMPAAAFSPNVSSSSTAMVPLPPSVTFAGSHVSDSWLYHT